MNAQLHAALEDWAVQLGAFERNAELHAALQHWAVHLGEFDGNAVLQAAFQYWSVQLGGFEVNAELQAAFHDWSVQFGGFEVIAELEAALEAWAVQLRVFEGNVKLHAALEERAVLFSDGFPPYHSNIHRFALRNYELPPEWIAPTFARVFLLCSVTYLFALSHIIDVEHMPSRPIVVSQFSVRPSSMFKFCMTSNIAACSPPTRF